MNKIQFRNNLCQTSYIKKIIRWDVDAEVSGIDDNYSIELKVKNYDENEFEGINIQIRPLFSEDYVKFSRNIKFHNLSKFDLSEFFILKVSNESGADETIIKIPVSGMPKDRKKAVISKIIDSEDKFIKYADFLLDFNNVVQDNAENNGRDSGGNNKGNVIIPEFYEKMLKATVKSPESIKNLGFLINNVSEKFIPDGFVELYNTFLKVVDSNG